MTIARMFSTIFLPKRAVLKQKPLILLLIIYSLTVFFPLGLHCAPEKSSSNGFSSVLDSVINGKATFPSKFGKNRQATIKDPDISLSFKIDYLNKVIAAYLKNPIALDSYSEKPRSFITVRKAVTRLDPSRNIIVVHGEGGVLNLGTSISGVSGKLTLKRADFEICPVFIKNKKGQFYLELQLRCIYLDIDKAAPFIDLSIAHALQSLYLNRKPINPVNVSELLNTDIQGGKNPMIRNRIVQAAAIVSKSSIEIRTAWLVD